MKYVSFLFFLENFVSRLYLPLLQNNFLMLSLYLLSILIFFQEKGQSHLFSRLNFQTIKPPFL